MVEWKTYAEAAEVLGLTPEAVRQRARRFGWRTTKGNDGKTLVLIPEGVEVKHRRRPRRVRPAVRPVVRPPEQTAGQEAPEAGEVKALRELVDALRAQVATVEAAAERDRQQFAEERARLLADVERRIGEAARAGEDLREARSELDRTRRRLDELTLRPWWRRLFGAERR